MSDLECDTAADAHGQPSEPNRDHKGSLNTDAHFMIDLAAKALACAPPARTIADDFRELRASGKERVLKSLVDEIMENLLNSLPEVEKDKLLDDCFTALYGKLPWMSQVRVGEQVMYTRKPKPKPKPKAEPKPEPETFIVDLPDPIDSGQNTGQDKGQGSGNTG